MTLGLLFLDQPLEQLDRLEADPGRSALLGAVVEVLEHLAADPGDRRAGTIDMVTKTAGAAHITPVRPLDWYVVWRVASPTHLQVVYIGPEI